MAESQVASVKRNPYEGRKTYPLRLGDDLAVKFQSKCSSQGRTMNAVLNELVEGYTRGKIKLETSTKKRRRGER